MKKYEHIIQEALKLAGICKSDVYLGYEEYYKKDYVPYKGVACNYAPLRKKWIRLSRPPEDEPGLLVFLHEIGHLVLPNDYPYECGKHWAEYYADMFALDVMFSYGVLTMVGEIASREHIRRMCESDNKRWVDTEWLPEALAWGCYTPRPFTPEAPEPGFDPVF